MQILNNVAVLSLVVLVASVHGQVQPEGSTKSSSELRTESAVIDTETYRNQTVDAYGKALAEGKYTVVLFSKSHHLNRFAKNLVLKIADRRLAKYSDSIIFCLMDPTVDKDAQGLHDALEVSAYPTLVILKTHRERIHVVGEVRGECELEQLDDLFYRVVRMPMNVQDQPSDGEKGLSTVAEPSDNAQEPIKNPANDPTRRFGNIKL